MNKGYISDELFEELLESVREGGAILRGEKEASRSFTIESPDVTQIRERFELSQSEFAALLGISVKTLQNWEQGRRTPRGAARVLLQVASKHPEAVWDVVKPAPALIREERADYKP
jgi:putative transcriptional regulator